MEILKTMKLRFYPCFVWLINFCQLQNATWIFNALGSILKSGKMEIWTSTCVYFLSGGSADKTFGMEMQLSNVLDSSLSVIHRKLIAMGYLECTLKRYCTFLKKGPCFLCDWYIYKPSVTESILFLPYS